MKTNSHNPFQGVLNWRDKVKVCGTMDLEGILVNLGFDPDTLKYRQSNVEGVMVDRMNLDPVVFDVKGVPLSYQREAVWSIKECQLLLKSIYSGIDIGKIVIRKNGYDTLAKLIKKGYDGKIAFNDIVDGKQRLIALISFIKCEYPDAGGYYFSDFTSGAKRRFLGFTGLTVCEILPGVSDAEVLQTFLNVNVAGVKVDEKHLKKVQMLLEKHKFF